MQFVMRQIETLNPKDQRQALCTIIANLSKKVSENEFRDSVRLSVVETERRARIAPRSCRERLEVAA